MAKSPEYPDLTWVEPRAWNRGRAAGQPSLIVIHTTESAEGLKGAENGAAFDARREDGTSTHYHHDQDTTVQCVRTTDRANTAKGTGNQRGIHHELSGKAAQDLSQWHDEASRGTLRNAARQCARDAKRWNIPVRHLTVSQVRSGEKGFCGHVDITNAFHESDHTDPGKAFPWTEFLGLVKQAMEGEVALEDDNIAVTETVGKELYDPPLKKGTPMPASNLLQLAPLWAKRAAERTTAQDGLFKALSAKIDLVFKAIPTDAETDQKFAALKDQFNNSLSAMAEQEAARQALQHGEVLGQVDQVAAETLALLVEPGTPDEQVASAMVKLLGDRLPGVLSVLNSR
jgi:hypothetical protein